ncbi:MAG: LysM peptidoglycan-binding domain-containing protein [Kiloniellales bacterium]
MKRTAIIAVVVVLAAVGFFMLSGEEPRPPVTAQVEIKDEPEAAQKAAPQETVQPQVKKNPAAVPQPVETAPLSESASSGAAPTGAASSGAASSGAAPVQQAAKPKAAETAQPAQPAQTQTQTPTPSARPRPPSFDVVRVEPSGEAVIAGRAAPGSRVTVLDGKRVIGTVVADERGQWAIVVKRPLAPGAHELSLEARISDGTVLVSENIVVVSVPRPQVAVADQGQTQDQAADQGQTQDQARAAPASQSAPTQSAQTQQAALPPRESERPLAVLMPRSGQGPIQILQQPVSLSGGLGEGTLILETIDYDSTGAAAIGGRAKPGTRVVIYLDDKPAGVAAAGADGRWGATLDEAVAPGLHRLRVDQVDAQGKVIARVETPFLRAAMVASMSSETSVIVQPGNSLWRIARRVYGQGLRYSIIYQANLEQIRDPDLIYPGQIFAVPPGN